MFRAYLAVAAGLLNGCCCAGLLADGPAEPEQTLRELRQGYATSLYYDDVYRGPPDEPPPEMFELVSYDAPLGENAAYVTPVREGAPRPGIVWIAGGFDWGISANAWVPAPRDNDQSARAFREAGVALMLPSLRGSNENPGRNECFFGEVEDVIAAAEYLASRPDVDPGRLYLGGHSTGGTLALLVAATTDRFTGVFAFGAIDDPWEYGDSSCVPEHVSDEERAIRAPIHFVDEIRTPTWLIEGAFQSNGPAAEALFAARESAPIELRLVPELDHFSVLAPGTEVVAESILAGGDITVSSDAILARAMEPVPAEPRPP